VRADLAPPVNVRRTVRRSSPWGGFITSVSSRRPKSSEALNSTRTRARASTSTDWPGEVMRTSGKASGSTAMGSGGPSARTFLPFTKRKR